MRPVVLVATLAAALLLGCGKEIGDDCQLAIDCDPDTGSRVCDLTQPGGYCSIRGCTFDSCPDESICVSFFNASFENRPCDPAAPVSACDLDEVCTLQGQCVPMASEERWCMRTCDDGGDCRDGYECRTEELMKLHGGQPVPPPDSSLGDLQGFCAAAPRSS
ncbi:MAG TPA: hypothetical protein VM734_33585 [Kofleriaceae bacterium]|nr:hypothetical protein [Kofleriaceae bacterium]